MKLYKLTDKDGYTYKRLGEVCGAAPKMIAESEGESDNTTGEESISNILCSRCHGTGSINYAPPTGGVTLIPCPRCQGSGQEPA